MHTTGQRSNRIETDASTKTAVKPELTFLPWASNLNLQFVNKNIKMVVVIAPGCGLLSCRGKTTCFMGGMWEILRRMSMRKMGSKIARLLTDGDYHIAKSDNAA